MAKKKVKSKKTAPTSKSSELVDKPGHTDAISIALASMNQSVLMKVCRLCESKDGPFLNIFDADKVTAKKIEELMPFVIAENDELPHKICFRCSAKLEELYEFVNKSTRTQSSLQKALGKNTPLNFKPKVRTLWEEKLSKTNLSNDDICDALIKKAMEGITGIPLANLPLSDLKTKEIKKEKDTTEQEVKNDAKPSTIKKAVKTEVEVKGYEHDPDIKYRDSVVSDIQPEPKEKRPTRQSKNNISIVDDSDSDIEEIIKPPPSKKTKESPIANKKQSKVSQDSVTEKLDASNKGSNVKRKEPAKDQSNSKENKNSEPAPQEKPFDIMDHVWLIKVNGVGELFQCKLCNRNFLIKDVVLTHGCAKNGVPKADFTKNFTPPEPPKVTNTVKYINTKITGNEPKLSGTTKPNKEPTKADEETPKPVNITEKPKKPRIGPASKVKRDRDGEVKIQEPVPPTPVDKSNVVQIPASPALNSFYKLIPGPNNTFTLVEQPGNSKEGANNPPPLVQRKNANGTEVKALNPEPLKVAKEIPTLVSGPSGQPYPVGLFQVPRPANQGPPPFTTPAMKKQSYTVVQTGNPSKLVISTKAQVPLDEVPKKRSKKSKHEDAKNNSKEPYNVTLEQSSMAKNDGIFTFINVDPLLHPSYVLPTNNIIQESQISTSTPIVRPPVDVTKDKYSCNMCGETFGREKKLLTHIQMHYSKMDEEDEQRTGKNLRTRAKKS